MKIKSSIAISGSGFIFNPDTGESFTVNPLGRSILEYLREGKSVEEISIVILEKYNVEQSTFEKDFEDFIGLLRNYSLVQND